MRGFKALHPAGGMDRADVAVRADDQVRRLAEEVAADSLAPHLVGDQAETLHDFQVGVERAAGADLGGVGVRGGIVDLEIAFHPGNFEVHLRDGIEGDLGDDVGGQVRRRLDVGRIVQLRSAQPAKRAGRGERDGGRGEAARAADVGIRVL